MTETFSKRSFFKLKALAVYQIVFGLWGIWLTLGFMVTQLNYAGLLMMDMIFVILYAYSIYCGILIFKKEKPGLTHSLISQYLQLISFAVSGYAFRYVSGIFITAGVDITNGFTLSFNLGVTTWNLQINTQTDSIFVGLNLVAMALIIFINKLKAKIAREQDLQVLSIGSEV